MSTFRLPQEDVDPRGLGAKVPRFAHGSRVPGWDSAVDLDKDPATIPDVEVAPDLRAEIEGHMAKYPDRRSAALPSLFAAQRRHGWCSPQAIDEVAAVMRLTPAYLESVATFYDMFDTEPVGKHRVYVCTNISCSLCGADELYEAMCAAASGDPDVNVRPFECLGACDIAPMASVNGEYVGPLTTDDCEQLLDDLHAGRPPLKAKQLRYRACADPDVASGATEFPPSPRGEGGTVAAGAERDATVDRPGGTAAIEHTADEAEEEDAS